MTQRKRADEVLEPAEREFYLQAMDVLEAAGIPYSVGGAYALAHYAGVIRHTKDLDVFLRRADLLRAFEAFEAADFRTELTHPHWLGKAFAGLPGRVREVDPGPGEEMDPFVDLIFRGANGLCEVDDEWLGRVVHGEVVGRPGPLVPPEELLWLKSWVMERHRFDGADVNHLLRSYADRLDWDIVLRRFAANEAERVLLGHLVFFGYVYPDEAAKVADVTEDLFARVRRQPAGGAAGVKVCRGPVLAWSQYLVDVREWGYVDGRLKPWGEMTADEVRAWTEAPK
jgi:hypothetical protein